MITSNGWARLLALLWVLLAHPVTAADELLRIAVASNFKPTLEKLVAIYDGPRAEITISTGSTGALYAQLRHGAPFDIFFAADRNRPFQLEKNGLVQLRRPYASGHLAFWLPASSDVNEESLRNYVGNLAIASPRHAPYGKAATETLNHMNIKGVRLARGSSVAQAFSFVKTGNAAGGLVALSQMLEQKVRRSSYWTVPHTYHKPIEQHYAVMKDANPVALDFIEFIHSDKAAEIILGSGYSLPGLLID